MLAAPLSDAIPANASPGPFRPAAAPALDVAAFDALTVPTGVIRGVKTPNYYSGYYANIVGSQILTATVVVPTVKCTNSATWGATVGLLALMDSGIDEHGGGVEVGCAPGNGTPTYSAALCDPSFQKQCSALADTVAPLDTVVVTVAASGGCHPTCGSLTVTVHDTTQGWSESSPGGTSNSDFDTFVVALGSAPLPDFGKVTLSNVSSSAVSFRWRKFNLIDAAGHVLARAGGFTNARRSFNVKWVRSS
ncbi:MAG TPA: hypothetical protein VNC61_04210 [Acidimicrobiales bacterium]|nr:hypothetical protein [Acidimicrobiales bacterium]